MSFVIGQSAYHDIVIFADDQVIVVYRVLQDFTGYSHSHCDQ